MKKFNGLVLLVCVLSLTGCKYRTLSEQLETEKQNLTTQLARSDSTLKAFLSVMREADANLNALLGGDEAASQQVAPEDLPGKLGRTIAEVTASMEQNKEKYQSARAGYISASSKVKALEEEVVELRILINQKDSLITVLNDRSAALAATVEGQSATIDEIKGMNSELKNEIDAVTGELNTAWYATGTADDLAAKNIITKTGGFLGFLGRVKVLSPTVSTGSLEKIDIREKTTFQLKCALDDVQFITHHPSGSYQLVTVDAETVNMTITDASGFWEGAKYLVIAY